MRSPVADGTAVPGGEMVRRIWAKDPTLWPGDEARRREIANRLGWLESPATMRSQADALAAFARDVRNAGFVKAFLLGMGGSSLAPEVFRRVFGSASGMLDLAVLDTTDPAAVGAAEASCDMAKALFIVSSKSGGTIEVDSLLRHFWKVTGGRGAQFIAITDPGTTLEGLAKERGFRRVFVNPPDIGGRFSVLSCFGLVPAALLGIDAGRLLDAGIAMRRECGRGAGGESADANPGLLLGVALAEAGLAGRDKVTFVFDPGLAPFGLWVEQLIAESLGKDGKGLLPVAGEPLGGPEAYGPDRVFVSVSLGNPDVTVAGKLEGLERAGHPVIRISVTNVHGLGAEFFRWEFATAVAGVRLGVNAFDQPNVQEAKDRTKALLAELEEKKVLPDVAAGGEGEVRAVLASLKSGRDYLAILAYLPYDDATEAVLESLRADLRDRLKVATTLGFGPRYLHSTGQMHKGGPKTGAFIVITCTHAQDLAVPGKHYSFAQLERAQALGDLKSLAARGCRAVRLHLPALEPARLGDLAALVRRAAGAVR